MEYVSLFVSNFKLNADTAGGLVTSREDLVTEFGYYSRVDLDFKINLTIEKII